MDATTGREARDGDSTLHSPQQAPHFDAAWLMRQEFPPLEYVVKGIIPEGLSILAAAPKIGKSWMVLALAAAVSTGGHAFEVIAIGKPRPVLYLALEDGQRRLQDRLRTLGETEPSSRLAFVVDLGEETAEQVIGRFFDAHRDMAPVAILDTLAKARKPGNAAEAAYERDYRDAGALKRLTDLVPGSSLIVVHHTRKQAAEDFLDTLSGTQGIAGAADSILTLTRTRGEHEGILSVTSRDAAEGEYKLQLTTDTMRWMLSGDSLESAAAAAQTAKKSAGTGETMTRVIEFVGKHPEGVRAQQVALDLDISDDTARKYLKRASDNERIESPSRGLYTPVSSVPSVPNSNVVPIRSNT